MNFLIGLLSVVLLLNCLLLILLVLIQLPKKEAGAGLAFGGAASDALFGAGSGNALTKITKYSTGIFFGLALLIGLLQAQVRKAENTLPAAPPRTISSTPAPTAAPEPAPATATAPVINTNASLSFPAPTAAPITAPAAATTNAPATP